jgi:hypothetical protein
LRDIARRQAVSSVQQAREFVDLNGSSP